MEKESMAWHRAKVDKNPWLRHGTGWHISQILGSSSFWNTVQ